MNKGLEALKYLKENKRRHWLDGDKSTECLDIIEKEFKALEIIKNKDIDVGFLAGCYLLEKGIDFYNANRHKKITQEEYDLLKEVLL